MERMPKTNLIIERVYLLTVAKWFSDNLPEHFLKKILLSMCNIQAIIYY